MTATAGDHARLVARLREMVQPAADLGSPLYATLLAGIADDVADRGPCWAVLSERAAEPDAHALPVRFLAAAHRLVLRRQAPALALHYPSVGGTAGLEGAWAAFAATVADHVEVLRELVTLPCQTNEVGRSAALAPGLGWAAARTGLPVHLHEIGSSAGLNLRMDRFRMGTADGSAAWGPEGSPVDLTGHWEVPPMGLPPVLEVASRQGCDPAPLDPRDPADRETLTAAVWADQPARHARLKGALALAGEVPAHVEQVGAGEWLARVLPERAQGLAVVVHSVVWRYIDPDEQAAIEALLHAEGAAATPDRALAWLRLETANPAAGYDGNPYPLTLTTWPGGETRVLAHAQAHGQELRWSAPHPTEGGAALPAAGAAG